MKDITKMSDHEITQYLREDRKLCLAVWGIEDVIIRAEGIGFVFNEEVAHEVIKTMDHYHDASYGHSWETMDVYIYEKIEENCYTAKIKETDTGDIREVAICSLGTNNNIEHYHGDEEIYYYGLKKEDAVGFNNGEFEVLELS